MYKTNKYYLTIKNTFYCYGDNLFDKSSFIENKKILNIKLKRNTIEKFYRRYCLDNEYVIMIYDIVDLNNGYTLIIIRKTKEKSSYRGSLLDVIHNDYLKNLRYLKENTKQVYIDKQENCIEIKYDNTMFHAVEILRIEDKYLVSCYDYSLRVPFYTLDRALKFDGLEWIVDRDYMGQLFDNKQLAFEKCDELLKWYNKGFSNILNNQKF